MWRRNTLWGVSSMSVVSLWHRSLRGTARIVAGRPSGRRSRRTAYPNFSDGDPRATTEGACSRWPASPGEGFGWYSHHRGSARARQPVRVFRGGSLPLLSASGRLEVLEGAGEKGQQGTSRVVAPAAGVDLFDQRLPKARQPRRINPLQPLLAFLVRGGRDARDAEPCALPRQVVLVLLEDELDALPDGLVVLAPHHKAGLGGALELCSDGLLEELPDGLRGTPGAHAATSRGPVCRAMERSKSRNATGVAAAWRLPILVIVPRFCARRRSALEW